MSNSNWIHHYSPIISLAPMDGYTDSAFRRICKEINPNIVCFTEFVSADGIFHNTKKVTGKLHFQAIEKPVIAQIFGRNKKTLTWAAKYIESLGFDGIDINMGCPAKNIIKAEQGIALRKDHVHAFQIIDWVVNSVRIPVSVKTRLGWTSSDDLYDFALGIKKAGASALTVHARTYSMSLSDIPDYIPVYDVRRKMDFPIILNGGIQNIDHGLSLLQNLAGFMIG